MTAQNLRDQAARSEKTLGSVAGVMTRSLRTSSRESVQDQAEQELVGSSLSEIERSRNFQEREPDLHTAECLQDETGNNRI